jgi:integrase
VLAQDLAGDSPMSDLGGYAADYVALRRALGYKLIGEGRLLLDFVSFANSARAEEITTALAVAWATNTSGSSQAYLARRLRVVRSFARHLQAFEPTTEVPSGDLFPAGKHRPTPYIYSSADITALMGAAQGLRPALRAATFETFIGLLASTGMRAGEAMALDDGDVDWDQNLLVIRQTKYNKSREVLLHPSTLDALASYQTTRNRLSPRRSTASLFVTTRGTRLSHEVLQPAFRQLVVRTGVGQAVSSSRPRVHGFRH